MAEQQKYNLKSPGVKRLMREAAELSEPTDEYSAHPLDDNLFEWHFTVRGPPTTEFDGGCYHGRILLPTEYPMKPPNIILLTPNGRFEVNKKICLSISGYHPETWQPSWSIRTALLALIAFMPTTPGGTIGSLDYTPDERKNLAKKSQNWECSVCGKISQLLSTGDSKTEAKPLTEEEENLIQKIALKAEGDNSDNKPEPSVQSEGTTELTTPQNDNEIRQRISSSPPAVDTTVPFVNNSQMNSPPVTCLIIFLVTVICSLILRRIFWL